jgi:hypothetical protein
MPVLVEEKTRSKRERGRATGSEHEELQETVEGSGEREMGLTHRSSRSDAERSRPPASVVDDVRPPPCFRAAGAYEAAAKALLCDDNIDSRSGEFCVCVC